MIDKSNAYDQYGKLNFAMVGCSNDSHCIGIYDAACRGVGPFMLIKNGLITSVFGTNCIYKKKMYGKLLNFRYNYKI